MSPIDLIDSVMLFALLVTGATLGVCAAVGFVVSLLQAVTQLQEQTIAYTVKLFTLIGVIYFGGAWFADESRELMHGAVGALVVIGRGR